MAIPESLNPKKAKLAANHPKRPGEKCRAEPATFTIVVDRGACEGKGDCVEVCPYGVFEVRTIADADFHKLTFLERLKSRVHGKKTAYTPKLDACQACGMCVVACPEDALELVRR